jgi:hypothetical protein
MKATANAKASKSGFFSSLLSNVMSSRQAWLRRLLDPRRDLDKECGYPLSPTIEDYVQLFARGDIAARVVSILPEETWSYLPQIYEIESEEETPFEKSWSALDQEKHVLSYLVRADILSGVGRFGVMLLGLDDGSPLSSPLEGFGEALDLPTRRLLYLRPLDESLVKVKLLESDPQNPRYGLPLLYEVTLVDTSSSAGGGTEATKVYEVYWHRVVHFADNRVNSEIYGTPRMQRVLNRLLDLRKIAGGSSEMFWRGGFPGYSLEVPVVDGSQVELDLEATRNQMSNYMEGLQRYIATVGMQVKTLGVEIADPRPHIEIQLRLIASSLGIPWRIFVGSEAAQLASEQDIHSWNRRLMRRQRDYVTPFVIRPFVQRLLDVGVLAPLQPGNTIQVDWPDLSSPTEEQQSVVLERRTTALARYIESGLSTLMPPFLYLTLVAGFSDEEARAILDGAEGQMQMKSSSEE